MRAKNVAILDELLAGDDDWFRNMVADATPKTKKISSDPLVEKFEEINAFVDTHGRAPDAESENLRESGLGARLSGFIRNNESAGCSLTVTTVTGRSGQRWREPIFNEPIGVMTHPHPLMITGRPAFSGGNDAMTSARHNGHPCFPVKRCVGKTAGF